MKSILLISVMLSTTLALARTKPTEFNGNIDNYKIVDTTPDSAWTYNDTPAGATTCDGSELTASGAFNKERYLYLLGHGSAHPNSQELKRNIPLDKFFAIPRVSQPSNRGKSMAQGLTQALVFHAAAAKFGLPGVTKNLVRSNSTVAGFTYAERAGLRLAENLEVSLVGKNAAQLTCYQFRARQTRFNHAGSFETKFIYFDLPGGGIIDPTSLMTHACNLKGSWDDIANNLYTVLKESYSAQAIDAVLLEKEIIDSKAAPYTMEMYEIYTKASARFYERIATKEKLFKPAQSMIDVRYMDIKPINKIIVHADNSTSPTLTNLETLNAKAYGVYSSGGCDASLVCSKSSCKLMSDEEYRSAEASLSSIEKKIK